MGRFFALLNITKKEDSDLFCSHVSAGSEESRLRLICTRTTIFPVHCSTIPSMYCSSSWFREAPAWKVVE